MKQVLMYETPDGRRFDSLGDCQEYEKRQATLARMRNDLAYTGIDDRIDSAYRQRNELAVALAKTALHGGLAAGKGLDGKADNDPDWRHVVYVELPNGRQVSWHMAPDCLDLLDGLPEYKGNWDGTFVARKFGWSKDM